MLLLVESFRDRIENCEIFEVFRLWAWNSRSNSGRELRAQRLQASKRAVWITASGKQAFNFLKPLANVINDSKIRTVE